MPLLVLTTVGRKSGKAPLHPARLPPVRQWLRRHRIKRRQRSSARLVPQSASSP
jgi:hypothetical protein